MHALLLPLLLCAGAAAQAAVSLDDGFENGNLDGWTFDGAHYRVNSNNPPGGWQWLHFRVRGVRGQAPRFKTNTAASNDVYRSYHRMVWRNAGERRWRLMDRGDKPGDGFYYFWNDAPFVVDEVYVAYWLPYTYSQLVEYLVSLADPTKDAATTRFVTGAIAGTSQQGRLLFHLAVTDPWIPPANKRHFVIVARQHGCESLGNYAVEGIIDWLLSVDPVAVQLRRRSVFHLYPMANPDAVVNGWTREGRARNGTTPVDFNRDWQLRSVSTGGPASSSREIDSLRNDILWRTRGRAAVLVDVHSHPKGSNGLGWYWWFHDDPPAAQALVTEVWNRDRAMHGGQTIYSWPQPRAGADSTTLGAWGSGPASGNRIATLGADSFTLEPIAAPFGSVRSADRVRAAGEALARAIAARY